MPGPAGADHLVLRGLLLAAGVAGDDVPDAFEPFEHRLDAPEAAAGENRRLEVTGRGARRVAGRLRELAGRGRMGQEGHAPARPRSD